MRYCLTEVYKIFSDDSKALERTAHMHYAINYIKKSKKILCEQYIYDKDQGVNNQLLLVDDEYMEDRL